MDRDDLSNDGDPRFVGEFYNNLKILSQDLFKRSAAAIGGVGAAAAAAAAAVGGSIASSPSRLSGGEGGLAGFASRGPSRGPSGLFRGAMSRQASMQGSAMLDDVDSSGGGSGRPSGRGLLSRQASLAAALQEAVADDDGPSAGVSPTAGGGRGGRGSTDFSTESLFVRMKQYAQAAGGQSTIPADYFDRYADQFHARAQAAAATGGGDPVGLEEKAE